MSLGQVFFSYEGRIGRLAFFGYSFVLGFLFGILKFILVHGAGLAPASPWHLLWALVMYVMATPLIVKRAHDLNQSGWWVLKWWGISIAGFVLAVAGLVALVVSVALAFVLWLASLGCSLASLYRLFIQLYFFPGSRIENDFGPPTTRNAGFEPDFGAQAAPQALARTPVAASRHASPAARPGSSAPSSARAPNSGFGRRRPEPA